ncbi:MAG: aspartate/glutamate racemase family protein [Deltaproteobacteria bacterium]|nr:aspartate/glutamate racemase family protein [Deltaproteobacteria bacterium]
MTRIKVIIPNAGMDRATLDDRERMLSAAVCPETRISVDCIGQGPESVESAIDEILVAPEVLGLTVEAEQNGFEGVVIYCFSDPGLAAARQAVNIPVIGPGQTAMAVAGLLGHKVSVLTSLKQGLSRVRVKLQGSGFDMTRLTSVRSLDIPVTDLREDAGQTIARVNEVIGLAVEKDGAEVVVLGCLGLAGYGQEAERRFNVPVIDPAFLSVATAEMFVRLNIRHR